VLVTSRFSESAMAARSAELGGLPAESAQPLARIEAKTSKTRVDDLIMNARYTGLMVPIRSVVPDESKVAE